MVQLRLTFLGTSASVPTKLRGLSSLAVTRGAELILFDAGEGTQRAMASVNLGFNRKTKVFITHLHGDHCIGLLGLLQTMAMLQRDKPIELYGPSELRTFLECNIKVLHIGPTYPILIHEVEEGLVMEERDYVVKACKTEHSADSYAYCLEEKERPGAFHPERALELGVPEGRLWSVLQKGGRVKIGDRIILPEDVLGPKRRGRKVGISGDTRPTKKLEEFFKGCDVLVFDSTYADEHAEKAVENLHSTAREAARLAKNADVKTLFLTHFSARYEDPSLLVLQASEIHPDVRAAYDFLQIDVPYPE